MRRFFTLAAVLAAACSSSESAGVPVFASPSSPEDAGAPDAQPGTTAEAGAPRAAVTMEWGAADVNRCVPDVPAALANIQDHGALLGFHLDGFTNDLHYFPGSSSHWQGVQRVPYGDGRTLVLSRGGAPMFEVARFASRTAGGRAFGANRTSRTTAPDVADHVVAEAAQLAGFEHAGGMQALGRYVAIPLENGVDASRIVIRDVAAPTTDVAIFVRDADQRQAGGVGLTKLADGRFLVVVAHADANELAWYITPSLSDWSGVVRLGTMPESGYGHEHGVYQTVNLVTQCDGALFLVGLHDTSKTLFGEDRVDLWRVDLSTGALPSLTWARDLHVFCSVDGERQCNFSAGAGAYVDPDGKLLVYGSEHEAAGPDGTVKMMEFAP